ncbi:hypothetical protein ZIOFF_045160 [Zingiber officinale]|uniref:Uncharacterized protein n=1 Tax=Zingiber officinale TaxID=94328 RepID=A0A8J5KXZ6_ZINOF|nr:hypothetical protein ZIOFF_045160 [Zingiber officinale]
MEAASNLSARSGTDLHSSIICVVMILLSFLFFDHFENEASGAGSSKLRYPLRSAAKSKDGKPVIDEPTLSSASKKGRSSPAVCKSMSVFNVSGKDNAAKHPRRLSIPTKPSSTPVPQPIGSVTPISETRAKRLNMQGKNDTPSSEASKSIIRRKFSVLSSASYWLTQIKLAELASKHSTSLGFFKLALESECEPLDRVREELKSYIQRHALVTEQEESVKDLLQRYNIMEDFEKFKVSVNSPKVSEMVTQKSDKPKCSIESKTRDRNVTPKALYSGSLTAITNSNSKDGFPKRQPIYVSKGNKDAAKTVPIKDNNGTTVSKKSQKSKIESPKEDETMKKSEENSPPETGDKADILATEGALQEDKENTDVHTVEEANCIAAIPVN